VVLVVVVPIVLCPVVLGCLSSVSGAGAGVRHHMVVMLVVGVLGCGHGCGVLPVVLVPVGCWRSLLLLLLGASIMIHPGAVACRAGGGCWAVPHHHGALVLIFFVIGW
jgi:hypothetical protein